MLEAVLVFGAVIFLGLFMVFVKLPVVTRAKLLGHPLALDLVVTGATLAMHWGTMTGLMSATMAGIICALATSAGRSLFGYIEHDRFTPGLLVKRI